MLVVPSAPLIELPSVYSCAPCLGRMLVVHGKMVAMSRLCVCLWPCGVGSFPVLFSRGVEAFRGLHSPVQCLRLGCWSVFSVVGVHMLPFTLALAAFHAAKKGWLCSCMSLCHAAFVTAKTVSAAGWYFRATCFPPVQV